MDYKWWKNLIIINFIVLLPKQRCEIQKLLTRHNDSCHLCRWNCPEVIGWGWLNSCMILIDAHPSLCLIYSNISNTNCQFFTIRFQHQYMYIKQSVILHRSILVMHFSVIAVFQLLGSSVRLQSLHELTMHRYIELSIAVLMILWVARRKSDSYWSLLSFPSYLKFNRETSTHSSPEYFD